MEHSIYNRIHQFCYEKIEELDTARNYTLEQTCVKPRYAGSMASLYDEISDSLQSLSRRCLHILNIRYYQQNTDIYAVITFAKYN